MENKNIDSRREFLKKTAYVVPTVITLGQLTNPINANAASSCISGDCGNGNFVGGGTPTGGNGNPSGGTDESDALNIFGK